LRTCESTASRQRRRVRSFSGHPLA
jgi:hypothetical protein